MRVADNRYITEIIKGQPAAITCYPSPRALHLQVIPQGWIRISGLDESEALPL